MLCLSHIVRKMWRPQNFGILIIRLIHLYFITAVSESFEQTFQTSINIHIPFVDIRHLRNRDITVIMKPEENRDVLAA